MKIPLGTPLRIQLQWDRETTVHVGRLAQRDRRLLFEFDPAFIASPLPISPLHLKARAGVLEAPDRTFDGLFGVFDDSLPDAWGRLLIDRRARASGLRPATLGPLDRLACVGRSGLGALIYEPDLGAAPVDGPLDLAALAADAQRVIRGEAEGVLSTLTRLGGSPGGTRPKVLVGRARDGTFVSGVDELPADVTPLIVKFAAPSDPDDIGPLEEAYARMGRAAGLEVPETLLIPRGDGAPWFAIERFDRRGDQRVHLHTLSGLLHTDHTLPSLDYDHLLRVTRRLTRDQRAVVEAWRRACFNVLAHNRDDHGKQFSFLMTRDGQWRLAPAYDLTYSEGPGGEHATTVEGEGAAPGPAHLRALAERHGLKRAEMDSVLEQVRGAVADWPRHARDAGVSRTTAARVRAGLQRVADG